MKLLLIQGANMEYLGRRQPELYGTTTARELDSLLRRRARALRVALDIFYTNTEGEAVSTIYKADRAGVDGVLFNPAGFLHAGHALRDCLRSIRAPAIEIHMTNIEKRGYGSITAGTAIGFIAGFGIDSYLLALEAMVSRLSSPGRRASSARSRRMSSRTAA
jgi:3-dehydroquinate dehydratase-2